jgi:hypothetical protein
MGAVACRRPKAKPGAVPGRFRKIWEFFRKWTCFSLFIVISRLID